MQVMKKLHVATQWKGISFQCGAAKLSTTHRVCRDWLKLGYVWSEICLANHLHFADSQEFIQEAPAINHEHSESSRILKTCLHESCRISRDWLKLEDFGAKNSLYSDLNFADICSLNFTQNLFPPCIDLNQLVLIFLANCGKDRRMFITITHPQSVP